MRVHEQIIYPESSSFPSERRHPGTQIVKAQMAVVMSICILSSLDQLYL
jgi:hypothetical protein